MFDELTIPTPRQAARAALVPLGLAALAAAAALAAPPPAPKGALDLNPPRTGRAGARDLDAFRSAPLFTPGRAPAPSQTAKAGPARDAQWRATGVSISGAVRAAVFDGPSGPVVLKEGEARDGLRVIEITPTTVTIERRGARRTVSLARP